MSLEYTAAASAVRAVLEGRRSLKNAIYDVSARGVRNVKRVYALTCETLRNAAALEAACVSVPAISAALSVDEVDRALLLVLAYEALFGAGEIRGGGAGRRLVLAHTDALRAAAGAPARSEGRSSGVDKASATTGNGAVKAAGGGGARWVRVNTLVSTVADAQKTLVDAGASPTGVALAAGESVASALVPYMLRLPAGAHARLSLHEHALVLRGALVLQDLPSALPAHALLGDARVRISLVAADGAPGDVIDACAAPGNKTSQLAALLNETAAAASTASAMRGVKRKRSETVRTPRVLAFDRDPARLELLESRIAAAAATDRVVARCADFLSLDPLSPEFAHVTAVLLDPSCSGSGMRARWGGVEAGGGGATPTVSAEETAAPPVPPRDAARVRSLADFQLRALTHAFRFPSVRRVVFSTCSLFCEENEDVVAAALRADARFKLIAALPEWPMRGVPRSALDTETAARCVRWHPGARVLGGEDLGETGFFVALFEREMEIPNASK